MLENFEMCILIFKSRWFCGVDPDSKSKAINWIKTHVAELIHLITVTTEQKVKAKDPDTTTQGNAKKETTLITRVVTNSWS